MKCFGLTDKGAYRSENQDSFIIEINKSAKCVVASLCDGMGGANAGALASRLANKTFVDIVYTSLLRHGSKKANPCTLLKDACKEANSVTFDYSNFDDSFSGMGTTLVGGIVFEDGRCFLINVGDSRAYHISLKFNSIEQITKDHSLVEEMVEHGVISPEEARNHPNRNIITKVVGSDESVVPDTFSLQLEKNDILLLCSDGLSNIVSDSELLEYAGYYAEPEILCRALIRKALNRNARDNVTVVAVMR